MQKRREIEEALELMRMVESGSLNPDQKLTPKVKHHIQGIIQGLTWVLDHSEPGAQSLKALLEQARVAHNMSGERIALSE